ncbi:MAG: hypothetical protein PHQ23_16095 [Candidatus Wallbacteria bacterium]|nr:hypothetical protein [Candidatus Wallbacteria bacterium]
MKRLGGLLTGKTVFITGNRKNAGKTTVLNHLVSDLAAAGNAGGTAIVSVGWDGEKRDWLYGVRKPEIPVFPGMIFVTAGQALTQADFRFAIMHSFSFCSTAGRYYALRACEGGHVILIGPENNSQLYETMKLLRGMEGCETVLVDGALDRISQVGGVGERSFVFSFCPSEDSDETAALSEFDRWCRLFSLPVNEAYPGIEDTSGEVLHISEHGEVIASWPKFEHPVIRSGAALFRGAVTDRALELVERGVPIVISDFTAVFSEKELFRRQFTVLKKPDLVFINYHPGSGGGTGFLLLREKMTEIMEKYGISVPLVDVMEWES